MFTQKPAHMFNVALFKIANTQKNQECHSMGEWGKLKKKTSTSDNGMLFSNKKK